MNETLEEDIAQLRKEIWSIAKKAIPTLQQSIENLQPGGSNEHLQSEITANANNIAACQTQLTSTAKALANCQSDLATISTAISALQDTDAQTATTLNTLSTDITNGLYNKQQQIVSLYHSVTDLETNLTALQNSLNQTATNLAALAQTVENLPTPEGGDTITVIYDKTSADPAINMGKPDGWQSGEFIDIDFTKYKRLRFYARMFNCDGFCDYDLEHRESILMTMLAPFVGGNGFRGFTASVLANKLRIVTQYGFSYTWNVNTNTFAFERVRNENTYYLYRIEGVS